LNAWEDTVVIATTGKVNRSLKVPLTVAELPPIRSEPGVVILRAGPTGNKLTGRVVVSSRISKKTTIARIEKPAWLDVVPRPNANDLPMELELTTNMASDTLLSETKAELVLVIGDEYGSVRLPVFLVR
jgi:hypothetical protein